MKDGRKKSGWLIVVVVVAILALYPLSLGPTAWLVSRAGVAYKDVEVSRSLWIYWPLGWCAETWGWDETVGKTLTGYVNWFLPNNSSVGLPVAPDGHRWRPLVKG